MKFLKFLVLVSLLIFYDFVKQQAYLSMKSENKPLLLAENTKEQTGGDKMTVKELIEKLSEYDGDLSVNIQNGDYSSYYIGSRTVATIAIKDNCIILND